MTGKNKQRGARRRVSRTKTPTGSRSSKTLGTSTSQYGLRLTADPKPIVVNPNKLFTIVQEVSLGTLTSSATPGTEVDGVFYHYMGQLDGYSQLAAVFDQYRFLQVSIAFLPRCMATATTGTVYPTFVGHLITAIDYDDAATTSAGLLRQKETANITLTTEQQTRTYTPHAALAAYSGTFTSYSNMTRMWIDSASPNVQHYSCKVALLDCGFASAVLYDVYARYVVQFRQVQ